MNEMVLAVLPCLNIKSTYTSKGRDTFTQIGWTLDKPMDLLIHLPPKVNSLGCNLVKSFVKSTSHFGYKKHMPFVAF